MKVINRCSQKVPINLEKEITSLLCFVPEEDLIGLDSITLIDKFPQKWHKKTVGKYLEKHKSIPARIEIASWELFDYQPYIFGLTPFIGKLMIALNLYLEIGHHCGYTALGKSKKEIKGFAKHYRLKKMKLAFPFFFKVIKPFIPLVSWYFRKYPE
jgi:hypothetical protein